jgi:hypothetical protein
MLDGAETHVTRFLSEMLKSTTEVVRQYYFVLLVSIDQEKTFLEKKLFRTHFWEKIDQKKANSETKKLKNSKNGNN